MQTKLVSLRYLKQGTMPELKLKQLQYETDTWKRSLAFMMDENIRLKIRLSEILKDKYDATLLEIVEDFQNNFIKEDELIGLLRNDIAELDKLFKMEILEDGWILKEIDIKLKNLRNNIVTAEHQFGKLQADFNSYLLQNL
jgi:hypothetical protein